MTGTQLTVTDLEVRYGKVRAVEGVSLTAVPGEVRVVLGANGAGKTSVLNAVSGLVPHTAGRIEVGDQRIDKLRAHQIARRGVIQVPEGRRMVSPLTVEENLQLGAYAARGRTTEPVPLESVYETFPVLHERRHVRSGLLSGGEQQMLALGRALMGQPEVILLDEPSMGLSPKMVDLIFERIAGIAATGPAVLTVEQNLAVLDISSYAYVLQHGHLVFEGDARVVADDPRVVEAYVGAGPDTVVIPSDKQEPR